MKKEETKTPCAYCKEEGIGFMGLIGWVCRSCFRTRVWPTIAVTDEDIDKFINEAHYWA